MAIKEKNSEAAKKWATNSEWLTVTHFLEMDSGSSASGKENKLSFLK